MFLLSSTYSDAQLLAMIKSPSERERNKALEYLYMDKSLWASVKKYVLPDTGNDQDVDEVFQESLIILDNSIRNNRFEGKSAIKTYFISIAKWKWYTLKRSRKRMVYSEDDAPMDGDDFTTPEVLMLKEERKHIVQSLIDQMQGNCPRLLELWQLDYKMEQIAELFSFGNVQSAKNAVARCRDGFRNLLMQNPELMTALS
jgi:RNA polymerase sigma factor (sigma-70 family)